MRIYLDLVILLNFLVDFLLLLGTNRLAGFPPGGTRAAMAASLGAIYSALCLLPGMAFLGEILWRMVFLGLMAVAAFGWNRSAMQRGAVFVLLSMALGGLAMGFGTGSFLVLVLAAGGLWLLCRVSFRGSVGQREYIPVELHYGDRKVSLIALRDTGNTLRDPLTGEQVLVAGADVAEELMGLTGHQLRHPVETLALGGIPGMRLIPYRAVGQPGSMLLAVRFEDAVIGKERGNPLVAFAPEVLGRGEVYRMLTGGAV
ncbi:MAG: sigma-E processing peptidase SpoIIGA [Oscillospiraceae bacterium]|nr:sigma-E processing peptidase SpoIIGA [Oscillospiraceae bacterium]